jgi:hypothetical protein
MKMRKVHQIAPGFRIALLLAVTLQPTCASDGNYLKPQEEKLGTDSDLDRSFHVVADEPQGFGLRMEGFIIGIEKSKRETLGVQPLTEDPHLKSDPAGFDPENVRRFTARLDDGERTFISHLVQAKLDDNLLIPFVKNRFLYDAYLADSADDRRPSHPAWTMKTDGLYARSWEALEKLEDILAEQLTEAQEEGQPYTHAVVGTMGWNTAQEKAIRNLNSIFGNILINQSNGFKPLYIAVTWPSEWNVSMVSLSNKANDADEIGFVWANALINRHLAGLRARASAKTWPAFKIVAIGHSLGARLMTRAAFSGTALNPPVDLLDGLDLVIGLQGAFSLNRFLAECEEGREGAPYADYKKLRGRVALTWSEHDKATPIAKFTSGANYAGAEKGYEHASDPKYKHHFAFYTASEKGELRPEEDAASLEEQVIYINASSLIEYEVLGTGGKAHSDIYNAYMGRMLGTLISDF